MWKLVLDVVLKDKEKMNARNVNDKRRQKARM